MDYRLGIVEYELEDGEFITMSSAPILLKKLKSKDEKAYKALSTIMLKGPKMDDVLSVHEALYNAYINLNCGESGMLLTLDEFFEKANQNFKYNVDKYEELFVAKKKKNSENASEEQ